jgi:hypothetical protein
MSKLVGLLVLSALQPAPADYQKQADAAQWVWSSRQASLGYCVALHARDYEVTIHVPKGPAYLFGKRLGVHVYDGGKELCRLPAHWGTTFAGSGQTLYLADFDPLCTGCALVTIDLRTGQQLWRTALQGVGLVSHSDYENRVSVETDGTVVTVRGKETQGR